MAGTDRCVVRNQAYRRSGVGIRERHNERKNEGYANPDIDLERSHLNVHYKQCEGTYLEQFDRLAADGVISTRGLGKDPKIIDELVFDVNTAYFDKGGGYEYAKAFFADTYQLAVKEAGGEEYILSAVMHADERNKALSEELGRDVYHYHLHVVYVPVVDKEVHYRKNNKDPELAGKLKGVVKQVSHSKKWPRVKQYDENGEVVRNQNGKAVLLNSYSLLQDRFFQHMREKGYTDFERGERGSNAQHLSVIEYKHQQESKRLEQVQEAVQQKESHIDKLDKATAGKRKRLEKYQDADVTLEELRGMGQKNRKGKMELTQDEHKKMYHLAKKGLMAGIDMPDLQRDLQQAQRSSRIYRERWEKLDEKTKGYQTAERLYPVQTQAALALAIQEGKQAAAQSRNRAHQRDDGAR